LPAFTFQSVTASAVAGRGKIRARLIERKIAAVLAAFDAMTVSLIRHILFSSWRIDLHAFNGVPAKSE
jgi:hypothetical protein